jgi:hypothetical protein
MLIVQRNYKLKRTISIKQFIKEFGENFSNHMKNRLLDLEVRSVLTRKDYKNILDIKHVEHTEHECISEDKINSHNKEFSFGQFLIVEDLLYFSESCLESTTVMKSPVIDLIYNNLSNENSIDFEGIKGKQITEDNIDYIIDTLLSHCPDVSQKYKEATIEIDKCAATKLNRISFNNK